MARMGSKVILFKQTKTGHQKYFTSATCLYNECEHIIGALALEEDDYLESAMQFKVLSFLDRRKWSCFTLSKWIFRYQEAAGDLEDRDARLAELYREAELGLELIGVTAIEDKLQNGVPESIHTLLQAGIKVTLLEHVRTQENNPCGWTCSIVHSLCHAECPSNAHPSLVTSSLIKTLSKIVASIHVSSWLVALALQAF